ncbi:MAG: hypothetical protein WA902_09210 [Thermosynechococcaceae cyanobacterium]
MKIMMLFVAIATLIGVAITAPAWAQEMQRSKLGNDVTPLGPRHFNPATVETITGKVVRMDERASQGRRSGTGMHVLVETAKGTVDVHLGPSWYLDDQKFSLKSGDLVEITGSRLADANQPTLTAAVVKSGDTVLKLRDENGLLAWRGMGQGRRMNGNRGTGRGPRMGRGQLRGAQ